MQTLLAFGTLSTDHADVMLIYVTSAPGHGGRAALVRTAPGVTVGEVVAATDAELAVGDTVKAMPIS